MRPEISLKYFNKNKGKRNERKRREKRKNRWSKCGKILIMLNLGDRFYEEFIIFFFFSQEK